MLVSYRKKLIVLISIVYFAACIFYVWQNQELRLGGNISFAKALWIATALTALYVIPGFLAKDEKSDQASRKVYRVFFWGYMVRGLIEIPLLIGTKVWRCWHGISHNLIMLLLLWMIGNRIDKNGSRYRYVLSLAICFESYNAWAFSKIGHPEKGEYFAASDPKFLLINTITWVELFILIPLIILWLWKYMKE